MMYLKKLQLFNFRNYENRFFDFSEVLNCVVGKNGAGKTNLIDAVYFLSLSKSSIHNQDLLSIQFEKNFMQIEGLFEKEGKNELISCSIAPNEKKQFLHDNIAYERISDHIGKYPCVLIAPDDTDLIRDGGETRRKLFDGIISQLKPDYLKVYQHYNRTLDQRNSLLKQFSENNYFDEDLINIYSKDLILAAQKMFDFRQDFIIMFMPLFQKHYFEISLGNEAVEIIYESELQNGSFEQLFLNNTNQDRNACRTLKGTHKDEFRFVMNQSSIKKFGSQGQKKSFVLAIKLAQFEIIEKQKGFKPILLLDDIFDKLDEQRIAKLIELIKAETFGQIFLTDARPHRTQNLMEKQAVKVEYIKIE